MTTTLLRLLNDLQSDMCQRIDDAERTKYVGESFSALLVMRTNKSYKSEKDTLINVLTQYATDYGLDTRKNKCWFGVGHWMRYRDSKAEHTYREYSLHYYIEPLRFLNRVAVDAGGKLNVSKLKSVMKFFD